MGQNGRDDCLPRRLTLRFCRNALHEACPSTIRSLNPSVFVAILVGPEVASSGVFGIPHHGGHGASRFAGAGNRITDVAADLGPAGTRAVEGQYRRVPGVLCEI